MTAPTFDTTGEVVIPDGPYAGVWTWERLEGFQRGYLGAAFAEWHRKACDLPFVKAREWPHFEIPHSQDYPLSFTDATGTRWDIVRHQGEWKRTDCQTPGEFPGFSDLHPETLSAMLGDCERAVALMLHHDANWETVDAAAGARLWHERQTGNLSDFRSIDLSLDDSGLIRQREVG